MYDDDNANHNSSTYMLQYSAKRNRNSKWITRETEKCLFFITIHLLLFSTHKLMTVLMIQRWLYISVPD